MKISENAHKVLQSRYLLKNSNGLIIESPKQLFKRVASSIAKAEISFGNNKDIQKWEKQFYKIISELKFLPNSLYIKRLYQILIIKLWAC
jgi:ribonucleoside-diphosphate reductase alpha chain